MDTAKKIAPKDSAAAENNGRCIEGSAGCAEG